MTADDIRAQILAATHGTQAEYLQTYRARHAVAGQCTWCSAERVAVCGVCGQTHRSVYCAKHKWQAIVKDMHRYAGLRTI
jgi:hypothetical protein